MLYKISKYSNVNTIYEGWNGLQNPQFGSYHGFVVAVFGSVQSTMMFLTPLIIIYPNNPLLTDFFKSINVKLERIRLNIIKAGCNITSFNMPAPQ